MRLLIGLALAAVCGLAQAHGVHPPVVVPPVVAPPVVAPPPAPPPVVVPTVTPAAAPAAPSTPAATGGSFVPWLGIGVTVFSAVFAWLAICQLEEERDPAMHKRLLCPKTPDWKQCDPFTQQPC